jgi:hypothetical protein
VAMAPQPPMSRFWTTIFICHNSTAIGAFGSTSLPTTRQQPKIIQSYICMTGKTSLTRTTSFSGEWEVDESLNELHAQGRLGLHRGWNRQWRAIPSRRILPLGKPCNTVVDKAMNIVEFIVNTLEALYRCQLSHPSRTDCPPASLAAVWAALFLCMRSPNDRMCLRKQESFSPAFWFADNEPANHVANHAKIGNVTSVFLVGS